jgi:hypothetical protein
MTKRSLVIAMACSALLAGILLKAQSAANSRPSAQATSSALDRMTAAGKSQQELAQYVFETHGCTGCHTVGQNSKLGFTEKGKRVGQDLEGCIALLTKMNLVVKVRAEERSPEQRQTAARFEEFGCTLCHTTLSGKMDLSEVGSRLRHLHLGCVDVEKLLARGPAQRR